MITQESIQRVKERINLVELISEVTELKRKGNNYFGCCPFHGEKTASFSVRADKSFYHCFGCGESGNGITFIMKKEGLSYPQAIEKLATKYNISLSYQSLKGEIKKLSRAKELYQVNASAQNISAQISKIA